jgi:hypothetical protein
MKSVSFHSIAVDAARAGALFCAAVLSCAALWSPHAAAQPPDPAAAQPAGAPAETANPPATPVGAYDEIFTNPAFLAAEENLTPDERVGRRIWLYATAGNSRFHTYVLQQRLGVLIDWYRVLGTDARNERFATWGIINDPDCCVPGDDNCPARSKDETFGFDWCPGDAELLAAVGRGGYRDPACDLEDVPVAPDDPHGPRDQRQDTCDLEFGTSAGAVGIRKFPNPRFDPDAWLALNGDAGTWEGYQARLDDASVEPPFLIGISCGSCHVAFNPLNPPEDPVHPQWENIDALVGNQYSRFSELLASGMPTDGLEWQIFSHARPGTVDTSAVPNDTVNNPGTINAIINFGKRPLHEHEILKWRKAAACPADASPDECWCEPGRDGKCWQKSLQTEMVPNILKGGEDSIGILEAIQRVYINIGSCSEQAWVNHLVDLRQADPQQRLFRQTPFDIGQARRDCANFRAIEDRLPQLAAFLLSARPTDLYAARGLDSNDELVVQLEEQFGDGAVARGEALFAANCARCHASVDSTATLTPASVPLEPFDVRDFRQLDPDRPDLRLDWLGNDQLVPASEVGTYRARALHSNHMAAHIWQEYGSETLRGKQPVADLPEVPFRKDGGRGYYRNISLLSVWAHAPFMHNNAIGPELCGAAPPGDPGWTADTRRNFYRSPYVATAPDGQLAVDGNDNPISHPNPPACRPFDPSVEGRFELFVESMRELLNPDRRIPKITRLAEEVIIPIGPRYIFDAGEAETGIEIRLPAGTPAIVLANLNHKELIADLVLAATDDERLTARMRERWGQAEGDAAAARVNAMLEEILREPGNAIGVLRAYRPDIQRLYSNSTAIVENEGHRFGESLSDEEKDALIAFLATL